MIILLLAFTYVFIVTYCWGYLLLQILQSNRRIGHITIPHPIISVIGIIALTAVGSFFSLAWRINWEFQVVVIIVSLVTLLLFKPFKRLKDSICENKSHALVLSSLLLTAFIILLYTTSTSAKNPDTGIYHAQAIRWIETYRIIPGLANIHQRLGYNSSWLMTNAIFSFSFLGGQSYHFMTGFLMLISTVYFFSGFQNILRNTRNMRDYVKVALLVGMYLFMLDQASSPGTDIPAAIFIGIIMCEAIKLFQEGASQSNPRMVVLMILVSFCLTVKLSTAPMFLLILFFIFNSFRFKETRLLRIGLSMTLIVIVPFLARNIVMTGYLIYPGLPYFPINFDWSIPPEIVKRESEVIHWFATLPNSSMERFESLSFKAWSREWFLNNSLIHRALICSIVLSPFILLALLPIETWRNHLKKNLYMLYLYGLSLLGALFWFFSAPAIRFGLGFLFSAIAIWIALLITWLNEHYRFYKNFLVGISIIGCITLIILFPFGSIDINSISQRVSSIKNVILFPRVYPEWSTQICEFKNFNMFCAKEYNSCWYNPFPCVVDGSLDVEMRSDNILDGFRSSR